MNSFNTTTLTPSSYQGVVSTTTAVNVPYSTTPISPIIGGSTISSVIISVPPYASYNLSPPSGGGTININYENQLDGMMRSIPTIQNLDTEEQSYRTINENNDCPKPLGEIAVISEEDNCPSELQDVYGECVEAPCDPGYVKDIYGNCVPISLPCKSIKNQLNNTAYKEKAVELKGKTHLKFETGYAEDKEGVITQLPLLAGGHSLDLKVGSNTKGYIHSHQNDYLTGRIVDGREEIKKPILMFSPADVIQLLAIAKRTPSNNIPLDEVYGTMIASTGNYTLKFNGNINDIVGIKSADDYLEIYKNYFEKYKDKEIAFLNFIKDEIKIDGISLYKIEDDGQIIQKTMNNYGVIIPVNCN